MPRLMTDDERVAMNGAHWGIHTGEPLRLTTHPREPANERQAREDWCECQAAEPAAPAMPREYGWITLWSSLALIAGAVAWCAIEAQHPAWIAVRDAWQYAVARVFA